MPKRPGHTNVVIEAGTCSFCGRSRNLRREEHLLGALARVTITCETCHRTLGSFVETAQPTKPEAPTKTAPAAASMTGPSTKAAPAASKTPVAATPARKAAPAAKRAATKPVKPATAKAAATTKRPSAAKANKPAVSATRKTKPAK